MIALLLYGTREGRIWLWCSGWGLGVSIDGHSGNNGLGGFASYMWLLIAPASRKYGSRVTLSTRGGAVCSHVCINRSFIYRAAWPRGP